MIALIIIAAIHTRPGYFTARCDGRLLCRSRQPLLDGARELLAAGYPADAVIVMKHAGSSDVAATSTIEVALRLTIENSRHGTPSFRRWNAPAGVVAAPLIAPASEIAASLTRMEAAE
jgi:hypothetical protein